MPTQQTHPLPLRRRDSATHPTTTTTTTIKPQAPQTLLIPFPCSRRRKPSRTRIPAPPSPPLQPPQQDRLQTALLYLAHAAAHLPPASAAAESLHDFAAPSWTVERWGWEMEREGSAAAAAAGKRGGSKGGDGEISAREKGSAGSWVRRAVGVLKREGEEGEYWRDGRDLEVLWGRVGGDCV